MGVIDGLEEIDVENHQRERPVVTVTPGHFTLECVFEVAAIEDLGEAIDGREPVHFVVVRRFEIVAGDELENRAADLDEIAVSQRERASDGLVVDHRAVR